MYRNVVLWLQWRVRRWQSVHMPQLYSFHASHFETTRMEQSSKCNSIHMLNETISFQNRTTDLDDFVNRIGTVPKSTTNMFYMYYRTIAVFYFLQQLKLVGAQTTRYQIHSSPTNLSRIVPFDGPTELCCTSTTVVLLGTYRCWWELDVATTTTTSFVLNRWL
jgi:hypothetical protein